MRERRKGKQAGRRDPEDSGARLRTEKPWLFLSLRFLRGRRGGVSQRSPRTPAGVPDSGGAQGSPWRWLGVRSTK